MRVVHCASSQSHMTITRFRDMRMKYVGCGGTIVLVCKFLVYSHLYKTCNIRFAIIYTIMKIGSRKLIAKGPEENHNKFAC